ncbi:cobyrinate a,c-diamide synthase [Lysobacter sp. Root690]|uniref:cobyrinate a,c-diamide synthase n=1 Tax=Lysobacter sp. Root690 TaxID=1736588 RepID=UPI0006FF81A6|nr:cobyrinate a,c-diamide synthase [Lysobacter sp. Root690]KRB11569.1 cobyrinic acid a,c-diamide synthase [Lysobacter sp. Root690]
MPNPAGGNARCPALLVSAPASGQGKTSVTAAIARWHARQGRRVRVFKTGPDFLDPMVLERASGHCVQQLDLWMCGEADVRARLHAAAREADLILIEGVMGLFDGNPSSADLAQALGVPVLAVIDGSAMAQTFGALATGLARYREGLTVYGVAANRIGSAYHVQLLRESLPDDLRWLGALSRDPALALPERHLGLVAAGELGDIDARLDALADAWGAHADAELPPPVEFAASEPVQVPPLLRGRRIAISRDAAFCFVYPANLQLLIDAGAECIAFSPIAGDSLPDCDAVWLPGGYPELHLPALSANAALREALHAHRDAGKPILAECGGLLYALDRLSDREGNSGAMAGLLRGHAQIQPRMAALGLQSVELPEGVLRGHTFHYAQAQIEAAAIAQSTNPNGGPSREALYRDQRLSASFVHFYFPSNPQAAARLFLP